MTRYRSLPTLAIRRMAGNWRLLSSVVLGTMIAGAILSATVIYADAIRDLGLKFAVQQQDPVDLDVKVFRSTQTAGAQDYQRSEDRVGSAVASALGPAAGGVVRQGTSATFYPVPAGETPNLDNDARPRGNVLFRSDLDEHVTVVAGELPEVMAPGAEGALPAAVGRRTAEVLGIEVGDRFDLFPFWDDEAAPLPVVVTGIIEPNELEERYWAGDPEVVDAPSRSWETAYFHVPESTFFGVLAQRFPEIIADYDSIFEVRLDELNARNAAPIAERLAGLHTELGLTIDRARVLTDLTGVLRSFDEKLFFTRIPLFVLLLQIGGIVAYYLVMVSTMLTERQTAEIATLRSRGATTGQLLAQYGVEGVILAAIAVITGPPLAAAVISALGPTPAFSSLSDGGPLDVRLSTQSYVLAGIGALLAFGALIVPAWLATRRTVVEFKRSTARPRATPAFLRYYLDVALVLVVALVFWRLSQQEHLFTESLFGETQADPFLLATPAVFMVTVGVVFLRLFPLVLRLVSFLVGFTRSVGAVVSLRSLVRNPTHYTRLVLLLMFATGVGMFGATFSATLDRSYEERADYVAGADVRAENLRALTSTGTPVFLDAVDAIPADAALPVVRTGGSVNVLGRFERFDVLGLDPEHLGQVAFWRDDFSATPLSEVVSTLEANEPTARVGVELPADAQQIGMWLKTPDIRGAFDVTMVVRDAKGVAGQFNLGTARPTDESSEEWRFYRSNLGVQLSRTGRPLNREPLAPPLTLEAFYVQSSSRIAASRGTILVGPAYTSAFAAEPPTSESGRVTSLVLPPTTEAFADGTLVADFTDSRYEPIDGFLPGRSGGELLVSPDAPPGAERAARLQWSTAGRSSPVRGIRERVDPTPLQVYLSADLASELELEPGDPFTVSVYSRSHEAIFAGTFELFPTYRPDDLPLAVMNANRLLQSAEAALADRAVGYNEAWFATSDPDATAEALVALEPADVVTAQQELLIQQEDPLVAAGWEGILAISFGAVLLLSAIGFIVYSYLTAQQRGLEFAILRTLGFSRFQVFTVVFVEQAFVIVAGMGLGTLVGLQIGRLMMDFLGTDERGREVLPPFELAVSWPQVFVVWGILGTVFAVTIATVVLLYLRLAVHRALRIGDA
jgi:hypothetical protein